MKIGSVLSGGESSEIVFTEPKFGLRSPFFKQNLNSQCVYTCKMLKKKYKVKCKKSKKNYFWKGDTETPSCLVDEEPEVIKPVLTEVQPFSASRKYHFCEPLESHEKWTCYGLKLDTSLDY